MHRRHVLLLLLLFLLLLRERQGQRGPDLLLPEGPPHEMLFARRIAKTAAGAVYSRAQELDPPPPTTPPHPSPPLPDPPGL
jgi:hypothetical protein